MATATRCTMWVHEERITVVPVEVPDGVTLGLTDAEAKCLRSILGKIGGDPGKTRRGTVAGISAALERAGYSLGLSDLADIKGCLEFAE